MQCRCAIAYTAFNQQKVGGCVEILQGAIHIFTDRPDLAVKSFYRELEYQNKHKSEYECISKSIIIQYAHAVSSFCHLGLAYDYIAQTYSKQRKAPVLVSIVGVRTELNGSCTQGFRFYWGFENECITVMEAFEENHILTWECNGVHNLKNKLNGLIQEDSVLLTPLNLKKPLDVVFSLSNELGIFLGGMELCSYLEQCKLTKKHELGDFYIAPT